MAGGGTAVMAPLAGLDFVWDSLRVRVWVFGERKREDEFWKINNKNKDWVSIEIQIASWKPEKIFETFPTEGNLNSNEATRTWER
jgi:hypothetical protein